MAAHIERFTSKARLLKREQTLGVREAVLALEPDEPVAARRLLAAIDRQTAAEKGWSFVMLSPDQNDFVVEWIMANATRPRLSVRLWPKFFRHMRTDTGEIVMTRAQMMEAVGASSSHVSHALAELVSVGALIRRQEGREVRWFMNPMVGTRLSGVAREDAQRDAPPLRFTVHDVPVVPRKRPAKRPALKLVDKASAPRR